MKIKTQKALIKLGEQLENNSNLVAQSIKPIKPRNYLALNPLLQKGGLHDKDDVAIARKKQRRQCKQDLRRTDWLRGGEMDG